MEYVRSVTWRQYTIASRRSCGQNLHHNVYRLVKVLIVSTNKIRERSSSLADVASSKVGLGSCIYFVFWGWYTRR